MTEKSDLEGSKRHNVLSQSVGEYFSTLFLVAFSILSLGGILTAEFRIAIGDVAPGLYAIALIGATVLVPTPMKLNWSSGSLFGVFLIGGIVFWVLSPFWGNNIWDTLGTAHADGWNHVSRGLYLWHYPRGETGNLAPIYQYASHLSETRWGASSLIALLSIFVIPGDPSSSMGLFFCCTLVASFFSYCLLARELPFAHSMVLPFATFAVALGWTLEMLNVGNFENFLFVIYPPSIIAILLRAKRKVPSWREASILAIMIINAGAGYPEGFGVLVVLVFPIIVTVFLVRNDKMAIIRFYVPFLIALSILGSRSFYRSFQQFFVQLSSASIDQTVDAIRPGEGVFPQLLGLGFPTSFMGIGAANHSSPHWGILMLGYVILVPALLIGVSVMWKKEKSISFSALVLFLLIIWQGPFSKYDYGLYKISTISHPIWISLIFIGLQVGIRRVAKDRLSLGRNIEKSILFLVCFGVVVSAKLNTTQLKLNVRNKYTVLENLSLRELENGIMLDVKDNLDHLWAVYFLRNIRLGSTQWRSYIGQPHLRTYMGDSLKPIGVKVPMLSIGNTSNALWANGDFSILMTDVLSLKSVENPNGLEVSEGSSYIWISNEYTIFYIQSPNEGAFVLSSEGMFLGPSRPNSQSLTLEIEDSKGVRNEVVGQETNSIILYLSEGENTVKLRAVELPNVAELFNGDRRDLLWGIRGYRIEYNQEMID